MTLVMEGKPFWLQFAVWACVAVFVVSFIAGFYAIFLVISRTEILPSRPEDKELSWGERLARRSNPADNFFFAEKFRLLRRVIFGAWTGAVVSFGILTLLVVLFGKRNSP
jgi:hypothetical protein